MVKVPLAGSWARRARAMGTRGTSGGIVGEAREGDGDAGKKTIEITIWFSNQGHYCTFTPFSPDRKIARTSYIVKRKE
jgi:hypothetical protein